VLYIAYWGASEPLGRSLVLPAVKRLAALGAELTLVTFEKPADLGRREVIEEIRASLNRHGVRWIPLRYHKRPKVPATAFDLIQGVARGIAVRLRARPDIIHARTFIGGLIGYALASLVRAKLIYHNEGFYPDEQVDSGVWPQGSRPHLIAKALEQRMYARADGIIALSHRAKQVIGSLPEVQREGTPIIVVPSCVDLSHFRWEPSKPIIEKDMLRFIYIGSVGKRYILDRVGRFMAVALQEGKRARLRVLTQSEPLLVNSMLSASGLSTDAWSVDSVPYAAMPEQLVTHDAGFFFLTQGISEHGCSPTKIGEYWAVGLPVISTPNVSDTDEIIKRERVGVIVREHSDGAYRRAIGELTSLLGDEELSRRCRRAAETYYALEPACERQVALYNEVTSRAS
jgi:glycosyltransferase involved in cell wall biosynthesis